MAPAYKVNSDDPGGGVRTQWWPLCGCTILTPSQGTCRIFPLSLVRNAVSFPLLIIYLHNLRNVDWLLQISLEAYLSVPTVERLTQVFGVSRLCVYTAIGKGGGYVCSWGQKRNHKFCRKDLFWCPVNICFASHIV